MKVISGMMVWLGCVLGASGAPVEPVSARHDRAVACAGTYSAHLQGICTDPTGAIYWSWTTELVKTDATGRILVAVPAVSHHGDLCYHDGRIYVAVNLGEFNQPGGRADSWVFVYDAGTLREMARHAVPEVVHGAGGIAYHEGVFVLVGGLPPGKDVNYVYTYDAEFRFKERHVLASGYTLMGIQTVAYADGAWWFGTYGEPRYLLRADAQFRFTGKWEFDASLGIVADGAKHFLVGSNSLNAERRHEGKVSRYRFDGVRGLVADLDAVD